MKRTIKIEQGIAIIPLTKGLSAIVDVEDLHIVDGFNWRSKPNFRADGSVICAYAARNKWDGGVQTMVQMHRAIMAAKPGEIVDHINGDGLDNRRWNLRIVTSSENSQNRRLSVRNKSGVKGVVFCKSTRKWQAAIMINGKSIYLGQFSKIEDAASAYAKASAEFHGEFGRVE